MKSHGDVKRRFLGKYIIPGPPVALARPRFGKDNIYDSQKEIKLIHGITITSQHDNMPLFNGPLHLEAHFYMPCAKDFFKKVGALPHQRVPDLSNLIKYIEDICIGILYPDDKLITGITAYKWYSDSPRTEFIISEIV